MYCEWLIAAYKMSVYLEDNRMYLIYRASYRDENIKKRFI